jgi:hypothetical protein
MKPPNGATNDEESADLSHGAFHEEVKRVRTQGLANLSPSTEVRGLLTIAQRLSSAEGDVAKIEDVLRQAIERLGGKETTAMLLLLGLTEKSRGLKVTKRREMAAEACDYMSATSFRGHRERQLVMAIANHLSVMTHEAPALQSESASGEQLRRQSQHDLDMMPFDQVETIRDEGSRLIHQTFRPTPYREVKLVRQIASYSFAPEAGGWRVEIDVRVLSAPERRYMHPRTGRYVGKRQTPIEAMIVVSIVVVLVFAFMAVSGVLIFLDTLVKRIL